MPQLQKAQSLIFEYAKLLTELWGRGVFYIFEASLCWCHDRIVYGLIGLSAHPLSLPGFFAELGLRTLHRRPTP